MTTVSNRVSNSPGEFSIATLNTHFGDTIRAPESLNQLAELRPDVLLLQEVTNPRSELIANLRSVGYRLVHFVEKYGLAIATHELSDFAVVKRSTKSYELGEMGAIEQWLAQHWAKRPHKMTGHGLQAVKLRTKYGHVVTIGNTRTTVAANKLARERQVVLLGETLTKPYFAGSVIMGGDMNHFPSPGQIDHRMRRRAQLRTIDIKGQATWRARDTLLYRVVALSRGKRVDALEGQLDCIMYRDQWVEPGNVRVIETSSDHRMIIASFRLLE